MQHSWSVIIRLPVIILVAEFHSASVHTKCTIGWAFISIYLQQIAVCKVYYMYCNETVCVYSLLSDSGITWKYAWCVRTAPVQSQVSPIKSWIKGNADARCTRISSLWRSNNKLQYQSNFSGSIQ